MPLFERFFERGGSFVGDMLTFKWSFKCRQGENGILDILQGKVPEVARFACTKLTTGPDATVTGYLETFDECTETFCKTLIYDAKWLPVEERFALDDANRLFENSDLYDIYVNDQPDVLHSSSFGCEFGQECHDTASLSSLASDAQFDPGMSMDVTLEDSIDFADLAVQRTPRDEASHSSYSHYNSQNVARWNKSFSKIYKDFVISKPGIVDVESKIQTLIPKSYPLRVGPIEMKRHHLQLAMFRGDFEQLLGHYVSCLVYLHPASVWHQKTPTDELCLQYFLSTPALYTKLPFLSQLKLQSAHRDIERFIFDRVVFCQPGGIIQPFARIWRSMANVEYEPGDRPVEQEGRPLSDATIHFWDPPIRREKSATSTSSLEHLMSWTFDSQTWFRHATEKAWSITGPITRCFADLGEMLANSLLRLDSRCKTKMAQYGSTHVAKHVFGMRSKHSNLRAIHYFAVLGHLLSFLNEIVSCSKVDPNPAKWAIAVLFNMCHIHELIQAPMYASLHVPVLSNIYDKPNVTMILFQLWRYSMILPLILCFELTPTRVEPVMARAFHVQQWASTLVYDTTSDFSGALPRVHMVDGSLKSRMCNWLISLCEFGPMLVSLVAGKEIVPNNIFDQFSIQLPIERDQDHIVVTAAANMALFDIEGANALDI